MKKFVALVAACLLSIAISSSTECLASGPPSYLILRAPTRAHRGHAHYAGRGYEVRTQAYAYGWFGAKPRRHLRRSTGYYESRIQWTKQ